MGDIRSEAALVQQPGRFEGDSDEEWSLDSSIAVVLRPPASLYLTERPRHGQRWDELVAEYSRELSQSARKTPGLGCAVVERHSYRTLPPGGQGGPFADVTELLLTLMQDANPVVQTLSGWLALADLAVKIPTVWKEVRFRRHEHDAPNEWPKLPLLSLPLIKALCVNDMVERYGIDEVPDMDVSTRPSETGGQQHPTGDEYHIVSAAIGADIIQRLVWIVRSDGVCQEKFLLLDGPPFTVEVLPVPLMVSPHSKVDV